MITPITSMSIHYTFFSIYFVLLMLTVWSYLAAKCADPGFVPRNALHYDKSLLPIREYHLWNYLQRHGFY